MKKSTILSIVRTTSTSENIFDPDFSLVIRRPFFFFSLEIQSTYIHHDYVSSAQQSPSGRSAVSGLGDGRSLSRVSINALYIERGNQKLKQRTLDGLPPPCAQRMLAIDAVHPAAVYL